MKPGWGIVSAVAAVVAVAVAVFVFVQGQASQSKGLEVTLVSEARLINEGLVGPLGDVTLTHGDRSICDYGLMHFRIANTGRQPIRASDFEENLLIRLPGVDEIVYTRQTASNPPSLSLTPYILADAIEMPPALLNPGDWLTLHVGFIPSARDDSVSVEVSARVVGIRDVEYRQADAGPDVDSARLARLYWIVNLMSGLTLVVAILYRVQRRGYERMLRERRDAPN